MVVTLLASMVVGFQTYNPTGTQILVQFDNGKSFVIATDPKNSPKTTKRVLELVKSKFYDGQRFHRVEGWVVQWGDPVSKKSIEGAGRSGSGKNMEFEGSVAPFTRGTVGVASTGARVGGDSQLFVVKNDSRFLDADYAVVGKVVKGMDVVDQIKQGDRITKITVVAAKAKGKK
ncbi:MAG: peptidylprolyl isomerase [Fimbriimonas sp.]